MSRETPSDTVELRLSSDDVDLIVLALELIVSHRRYALGETLETLPERLAPLHDLIARLNAQCESQSEPAQKANRRALAE